MTFAHRSPRAEHYSDVLIQFDDFHSLLTLIDEKHRAANIREEQLELFSRRSETNEV